MKLICHIGVAIVVDKISQEWDEQTLKRMKETPPVKLYDQPLDPVWVYDISEYRMAYLIERHPLKDQYTLSISRKDGQVFDEKELLQNIPKLFEIFTSLGYFEQRTHHRGFVRIYVINNIEVC